MNKWRHTPKAGMYSIAQVQTYVVKALQGIRQWCQQPIGNWSNGRSLWSFVCLFLVGVSLSVTEYTTQVYKNAPVLTKDAREASDLFFQQNQGDVLINYENEVILTEQNGQKLPYVIPDVNISIDNPVTVVDKNVDKHGTREVAEAFVDFLYSTEAQREFAKLGYRPVNPTVVAEVASQYPQLKTLFTVQDLGGWDEVQKNFFVDGATFDKIQGAKKA